MAEKFIPRDYQREIIDWITSHKRCAIWAAMGSGKTVSTLMALETLALAEDIYPVLVIAPLRVAQVTWPDELERWDELRHLSYSAICGMSIKRRERAADRHADIYFTNYENLTWLVDYFDRTGQDWPYKTVVVDEATKLKSFRLRQGSKRAAALGKMAHRKDGRIILLTGTPAANGIKDLWGQIWFIDKGERLGRTHTAFIERWFQKGYDGYSLQPMPHAQKEIEDRLKDVCLTVRGLPVDEPIYNNVYVQLPPKVRDLYREMQTAMLIELNNNQIDAANAAVKTMRLLQLGNGAIYIDADHNWEEVHRAKLDALESIIAEAAGMPVLVAYHFKSDLERLQRHFPKGRVLDANPDTIRDWNAGRIQLLFAHPSSAGHGLSLQHGGNILAFFSLNWNLEEYAQIIERIGPMRQKQSGYDRPVFVHHIIAHDSMDEIVLDRLRTKKSVQEVLLNAMVRAGIRKRT